MHHHLVREPPGARRIGCTRFSGRALRAFRDCGADIVFSGHNHYHRVLAADGGHPVLCQAGTATSSRGRVLEPGQNSFNFVRAADGGIEVQRYLYDPAAKVFLPNGTSSFPRRAAAPVTAAVPASLAPTA